MPDDRLVSPRSRHEKVTDGHHKLKGKEAFPMEFFMYLVGPSKKALGERKKRVYVVET